MPDTLLHYLLISVDDLELSIMSSTTSSAYSRLTAAAPVIAPFNVTDYLSQMNSGTSLASKPAVAAQQDQTPDLETSIATQPSIKAMPVAAVDNGSDGDLEDSEAFAPKTSISKNGTMVTVKPVQISTVPTPAPKAQQDNGIVNARATMYSPDEDPVNKNNTASGIPGKTGVTIAVDPKKIPFGTVVQVLNPEYQKTFNNGGYFIAMDTGSDVKSQKASNGKKPVIDFHTDNKNQMGQYSNSLPENIQYRIVTGNEANLAKQRLGVFN